MFVAFLHFALMASAVCASAIPSLHFSNINSRSAGDQAAAMLLQIAPTSDSCSNAPAAGECATSNQAAPFLIDAMAKYNITHPPEIAAVLSLIAFETADFKYNTNHYPGTPGQGTRKYE